jgi:hypothetical protein
MAFDPENPQTPSAIGNLKVILHTWPDAEGIIDQAASFQVEVLDQNGQALRHRNGSLIPHLTPAQRSAISQFMADLRDQAEAQIIGASSE